MIIVDAHCDTITRIMETGESLSKNTGHIDVERLGKIGSYVQFFAAFVDPAVTAAYTLKRAVQIIDKFYEEVESNKEFIMLCCNYNQITTALKESKTAAVLSIENGGALQGDISALRIFYRLGVRSICLTWNGRNEIADGASEECTGGGLTSFGRKVVKEMNKLGMLVDLSHITERGFWDVMELTAAPVIVSHSNAKNICGHRRNLTDSQIMAVKENGGVIGINLYPPFLNSTGKAYLKDAIKHIEYILALAGSNCPGIGSDFDGIEYAPEDIKGVQDLNTIFDELLRLNYPEEIVRKLAGENFLRVIKQVLG